jgi:hypothetical protein
MGTMVLRLATMNNILPLPLTIHATKNIVKLFHTEFLQRPLEDFLRLPHTELLLHLLKEVGGMEP